MADKPFSNEDIAISEIDSIADREGIARYSDLVVENIELSKQGAELQLRWKSWNNTLSMLLHSASRVTAIPSIKNQEED